MANEISITATLRYAKDKASASQAISYLADQTGDKYSAGIQSIGTTEEALQKNDVGTIGYLAIRNMDTVNYVDIGATTGVYSLRLQAGKGALVAWNGTSVLCKANTAACEVEYLIIEA